VVKFVRAISAFVLVFVALFAIGFMFWAPVPSRALRSYSVRLIPGSPAKVHISGVLLSSGEAVWMTTDYRSGSAVVVNVRAGLVSDFNRNGSFDRDVSLPPEVNEIAIGSPQDVIWRRP
jgi:hypothetical protein